MPTPAAGAAIRWVPRREHLRAMKRAARLALALFGSVGAASRVRLASRSAADHPVEKVIKLLQDLDAQAVKASQEEEYEYGKFHKWCQDSESTLSKAIEKGKAEIDSLKDKVSGLEKEEKSLVKAIDDLGTQILEHEAGGTTAKEQRDEENKVYTEADKDLGDTIDAFAEAITALEDAQKSSAELVQEKASSKVAKLLQLPPLLAQLSDGQRVLLEQAASKREVLAATPAVPPEILAAGDAAQHQKTYNFKSGNVIELLKELKAKFEDDRVEATKAETAAKNAYDLAEDARSKAIEAAKSAKTEKETLLGEVQGDLATDKADLKTFEDDLKADEATMSTTKETCTLKASEYEERSALREKEKEAIAKAIEILAKVSGVRTEQPENPVPPPSPLEAAETSGAALFQLMGLMGDPQKAAAARERAVNLLRREARRSDNKAFAEFAEQVAHMVTGPFDEVQGMIQKMIFRLMAEQKDEDEHKTWCDLELEKTNISKTNKEEKIAELESKINTGEAKATVLAEEIEDAHEMVATLEEHMKEATEIRQAGSKENAAAVEDAKDAQTAIAQATAVLEAYYKESGMISMSQVMLQGRHREPVTIPEEPSTWDASYTGIADPNSGDGIISMLKEISADFARMEADTLASEAMDKKMYDEEMSKCEIEKAKRAKEAEMKTDEKKRLTDKVASYAKSLKHTTSELEAVEQYSKDLSPACLEGSSTYEDRKAARSAEIEALKQAQVILEEASEGGAPAPAPAAAFLAPARPH